MDFHPWINSIRLRASLWSLPQREFQYVATGLVSRLENELEPEFITTIEYLLITKSWWDTVDSIAGDMVGPLFKRFPKVREKYLKKWRKSDNFWLRRTTLLFQLGYKEETDFDLLCELIHENLGSDEFFINKAIGWALRQYAWTNPKAVKKFVKETKDLHPLSRREALKNIGECKTLVYLEIHPYYLTTAHSGVNYPNGSNDFACR